MKDCKNLDAEDLEYLRITVNHYGNGFVPHGLPDNIKDAIRSGCAYVHFDKPGDELAVILSKTECLYTNDCSFIAFPGINRSSEGGRCIDFNGFCLFQICS